MKFLRKYIARKFGKERQEYLFQGLKDVIIKTLICTEPNIVKEMNKVGDRQKCCFEVYGFDLMFDEEFKPWVLEVNCLPSLSSSSMFDKQVKTQLISDCFSLIGIRGYNKNEMRRERQLEVQIAQKEGRTLYPEKEPVFKTSMKI